MGWASARLLLPPPHVLFQSLLRQKEADLKQANTELEERGKLLYKTKVCGRWKRCTTRLPLLKPGTPTHMAPLSPHTHGAA